MLRLYLEDRLWRGAVDTLVLGLLILLLDAGLPRSLSPFHTDAHTSNHSANFSPAPLGSANWQAPASQLDSVATLPRGGLVTRDWHGEVSAEAAVLFNQAADLIDSGKREEAIDILAPFAMAGDANAQLLTAAAYTAHKAVDDYETIALYWRREAANQGHPHALYEVGQHYRLGMGTEKDLAAATRWYERAIANGHHRAPGNLGRMYEKGEGRPKNLRKAIDLYKTGASLGDHYAQAHLAQVHYWGRLNPPDYAKAYHWAMMAAAQGNRGGQYYLARIYREGRLGEAEPQQFLLWASRAADQGHKLSMMALGDFYRSGEGGKPDYGLAFKWYQKAAMLHHPNAQYQLAQFYSTGRGAPKDPAQAYIYYSLALKNGLKQRSAVVGQIAALRKSMTPAQRDYAAQMVRALTPSEASR